MNHENSPILKDMVNEALGAKHLVFYCEIGPKSAIGATSQNFCFFSAEQVEPHSMVIDCSSLHGIAKTNRGKWEVSIQQGESLIKVAFDPIHSIYAKRLEFAMKHLASIQKVEVQTTRCDGPKSSLKLHPSGLLALLVLTPTILFVCINLVTVEAANLAAYLFILLVILVSFLSFLVFVPGATRQQGEGVFSLIILTILALAVALAVSFGQR